MKQLIAALSLLVAFSSPAQTLFTYGKETVTVPEFLKAYQRNNTGVKDEASFRQYLDLYIASRLKIREARAKKLDTSAQMKSDLAALHDQIAASYIVDKATRERLLNEIITRSKKDLRLQHIFISFRQGTPQQLADAKKKRDDLLNELKQGKDFSELAKLYSDDPSAKTNNGNLGWTSVFSLPYIMENLAYSTAVGKVSDVAESNAGYHIVKVLEERNSAGRVKAEQILLAFPPGATDAQKNQQKNLADSLHRVIAAGADFGALAEEFSNDVVSAASKGVMAEFGVGEFDTEFEQHVFALKTGELSKPFATAHGYHIVKLLQKGPLADQLNEQTRERLSLLIEQSDRIDYHRNLVAQNMLKENGKILLAATDELVMYTVSALDGKKPTQVLSVKAETPLLQVGSRKFTAKDWIEYAAVDRYKEDGTTKTFHRIWNEFLASKALEYYTANLNRFNPDFRQQMKEFEEGNLFFEIMQRQVWTPAQKDSLGQVKYFQKNQNKYKWEKSADAIIFYAPSQENASHFASHLSPPANPAGIEWRSAQNEHSEVSADSSRFEWSQIPNSDKISFDAGKLTPPLVNKDDSSVSFAYIIRTYPASESKTFAQARAAVVTDYQEELEHQWIASLKKKYPVVINQKAWADLVKSDRWRN